MTPPTMGLSCSVVGADDDDQDQPITVRFTPTLRGGLRGGSIRQLPLGSLRASYEVQQADVEEASLPDTWHSWDGGSGSFSTEFDREVFTRHQTYDMTVEAVATWLSPAGTPTAIGTTCKLTFTVR